MKANIQKDAARPVDQDALALALAGLGYPGLSQLRANAEKRNPAAVLLVALSASELDSRLVEALPWVLLHYPELDWSWLLAEAKARELQNRLGFVISIAHQLAEKRGEQAKAALLSAREAELEPARLEREDTLCHASLTEAEKRWLRARRTAQAKRWGLLSDLAPEHLPYAA